MSPADRERGLDATGERLVPDRQHGELVHAEHIARYRLAAQLASGRRVLDAACGEGYGTAMLAAAGATETVGVDLDEATVAHAVERHGIDARVGDVASLPFDDDAFDLVVSFETIEHVPEPERVLDELVRVLAPAGLLVISTPNKHEYLVENEFHVREFTHEEFVALLEDRLPAVRLLYQHNWLTSAVLERADLEEGGGERRLEADLHKTVAVEPGRELYVVAVCGEQPDVELRQVGVVAGLDEAHSLATRLVEAERTAEQWHAQFKDAERGLKETQETADWMRGTLSWRLTKPFRAVSKLRGRR